MTRDDMHHLTATLRNAAIDFKDAYYQDNTAKFKNAVAVVRRALNDAEATQREEA
jgi:hypothetical protein